MVVTISPSFNLYKIVVFPAASSPTTWNTKNSIYSSNSLLHLDILFSKYIMSVKSNISKWWSQLYHKTCTCTTHVILQVFWLPLETVRPVKKVNTNCTRRLTATTVTVRKLAHKEKELKMTTVLQDTQKT